MSYQQLSGDSLFWRYVYKSDLRLAQLSLFVVDEKIDRLEICQPDENLEHKPGSSAMATHT